MPRPLIRLYNKSQADLTNPVFVYEGSKLTIESAGSLYCLGIATGDYIELTPGVINTFITVLGSNTLGSPTGGYYSSIETITYNIVQVTPRYALL